MPSARIVAALAAVLLSAACDAAPPPTPATAAREGTRFVVVTHGQSSDAFWSVVANGVHDAAADLGVRVEYQAPTSFDMVRMSQLIEAAVVSRPSGLIVSIPDADALRGALQAASAADIPILGINAGADVWQSLGLLGYIGQTEYEAGHGAGQRLGGQGVKNALCVNHEVGNASLDERCRGFADGIGETGGRSDVIAVDLADPDDAQQRISSALATRAADGMLTLGPAGAVPALAALRTAGRTDAVRFGTFDLGPEILLAVEDGDIAFAIDQQPYLQGYLAIVLMTKYVEAGVMPGGGQLIRTGPSFVTRETAADVIRLTEQGIR